MSQSAPAAAAASAGQGPRVVWVTRHGEREDVVEPHWYERPQRAYDDPPLADKGRVQAGELAARLRDEHIEHIVSSPFVRCVETAHIVSAARRTPLPVKVEPGICEIVWLHPAGNETPAELKQRYPLVDDTYVPAMSGAAGVEHSSEAVYDRVVRTLAALAHRRPHLFSANVLYVGHAASTAAIVKRFTCHWRPVGLCTVTKLMPYECGLYYCDVLSDSRHLADASDLRPICDC